VEIGKSTIEKRNNIEIWRRFFANTTGGEKGGSKGGNWTTGIEENEQRGGGSVRK